MREINELNQSKYCYKGTDVLINNRNIMDQDELRKQEITITTYKLSKLYLGEKPFKKTYDLNHYLNIHKYLFEDIYPFAGCLRDENISKSNEPYMPGKMPFCQVPFILEMLKSTLMDMRNNVVKIKKREDIISFISHYCLELNVIHPFREGNGRTQREYFREYMEIINKVLNTDYEINYDLDENSKKELQRAMILDNEEETKKIFDKMVQEKTIIKENNNLKK